MTEPEIEPVIVYPYRCDVCRRQSIKSWLIRIKSEEHRDNAPKETVTYYVCNHSECFNLGQRHQWWHLTHKDDSIDDDIVVVRESEGS